MTFEAAFLLDSSVCKSQTCKRCYPTKKRHGRYGRWHGHVMQVCDLQTLLSNKKAAAKVIFEAAFYYLREDQSSNVIITRCRKSKIDHQESVHASFARVELS